MLELKNKKVLVVGLGKSGLAAALFSAVAARRSPSPTCARPSSWPKRFPR